MYILNTDDIIEQQFRNEIKQYLKNIPEPRLNESQKLMKSFLEKIQTVNYAKIFPIDCESRERTLIWSALYLLDYEGRFGFCVNLVLFLFVANDPDKKALSFEVIENNRSHKNDITDFKYKCKFLAEKKFKTFDETKYITLRELRELRNTIAHFNFIIDEDGVFKIFSGEPDKRTKNMMLEHGKLLDYTNALIPALRDFLNIPC